MRALLWSCCLSVILVSPLKASGLPHEHEAERLMLLVEAAISEGNWGRAQAGLAKLDALERPLSDNYHYFYGLVRQQLGEDTLAKESFEAYVIGAGKEGGYYRQSLEFLTRLEDRLEKLPDVDLRPNEQPSLMVADSGYLSSLKALYLTDDTTTALVFHANSLLAAHAYTGTRLKSQLQREGVQFSISVNGSEILIQKKSYEGKQPLLTVDKLNVLGVDPFVERACSASEQACWLYSPGQENVRWLFIQRDELVIDELVQVMSRLIRTMQAR